MQKRILVTGAAGFIGFHTAKACIEKGHIVTAFDNFSPYYDVTLKRARSEILRSMGLEVQTIDLQEKERIVNMVKEQGITHVVHLAAQAGVRYSFTHPQTYIASNLEGFLNILEACRMVDGIKLIYASSSSVYGANKKIPFHRDDPTDQQTNFYGVTKKSNELMAHSYHHLFGIPTIGLRFFTVYGPWGRPDMAYFSFAKAISEGRPIDVFHNGKLKRDFTYIDDVVSAVVACLDSDEKCAVFNVGNEKPQSVEELILLLENCLGKKAQKIFLPMQQGEIFETCANIDATRERLGFSPKTSLKEGIECFVDWYKNYYLDKNYSIS